MNEQTNERERERERDKEIAGGRREIDSQRKGERRIRNRKEMKLKGRRN